MFWKLLGAVSLCEKAAQLELKLFDLEFELEHLEDY